RFCRPLFFFFQAEDGIRDFHVTGVQTCALPISAGEMARVLQPRAAGASALESCRRVLPALGAAKRSPNPNLMPGIVILVAYVVRSEERRVGKECRCRSWRQR